MRDGQVVADPERDLAKIAVVERHHATGRIGLGLVRGFGLRRGRVRLDRRARRAQPRRGRGRATRTWPPASARLQEIGGGIVVARDGGVRGELPLPVAGLLSDEPVEEVVERLEALQAMLREQGVARRRAVHDALLPRPVGDPVAQDHRPRAGRRRPLRARPARRRGMTGEPLWRCPVCGQRFVTRNMPHSCQVVPLDEFFEGAAPELRDLFELYVAATGGDVTVNATKSRIALQARMRFAGIDRPRRRYLLANFVLTRPIESPRLARVDYVRRITTSTGCGWPSRRTSTPSSGVARRGIRGRRPTPRHRPGLARQRDPRDWCRYQVAQ